MKVIYIIMIPKGWAGPECEDRLCKRKCVYGACING
jgi:hypothetical protein